MQEEVENRTLTLIVSGTKFTGRLLTRPRLLLKRQGKNIFQKNRITGRTNCLFLSWLSRRGFFLR